MTDAEKIVMLGKLLDDAIGAFEHIDFGNAQCSERKSDGCNRKCALHARAAIRHLLLGMDEIRKGTSEMVYLLSGDYGWFWRQEGAGYTLQMLEAWCMPRAEAEKLVQNNPDKKIRLIPVARG